MASNIGLQPFWFWISVFWLFDIYFRFYQKGQMFLGWSSSVRDVSILTRGGSGSGGRMFLLISTLPMDMGTWLNSLSFNFLCLIPNVLIGLCLVFFSLLSHVKSAAGRLLGSEGQCVTCLTTRSSFTYLGYFVWWEWAFRFRIRPKWYRS